jgi:hypothetical protein
VRSQATSLIAGLALAAGALIVGCAAEPQQVKTVTVDRPAAAVTKPHRKKHHHAKPRSAPSTPTKPATSEFVSCDANIEAKAATTTCPFAENLFWAYWMSGESGGPLEVWSPAARASFVATCDAGGEGIVCTTSDDAVVRFAETAVEAYSQTQADRYGATHDLGPDPYDGLPPADAPPDTAPSDDCQGYDPCLEPGPDVDCEGGSGNGPRYVEGPVYVDGSDPYGLDGNYDGVGCEY